MSILHSPIVSNTWLQEYLDHPSLVLLDATIPKVTQSSNNKLPQKGIAGAQFMDLKRNFSDPTSLLPNTLPSPEQLEQAAQELGIQQDSVVIIYDALGIYSSARAWWLFKIMGHPQVAVLDGGLKGWEEQGFPLEALQPKKQGGTFKVKFQKEAVLQVPDVLAALQHPDKVVLDARSQGRFLGQEAEPRAGLRSGHMPHALNLPYSKVLDNGHLLPLSSLKAILGSLAHPKQELIFTCGSGVTACILLLAAHVAGYKQLKLYDGSWSEWGQLENVPIESI